LVHAVPKLVCEWLDEHYTRELVHQVGEYVSRTMVKESLGYQSGGVFITFQALVDDAVRWNLFSKGTAKLVRKLAKEGDGVLHEKPTTSDRARTVLTSTRAVIRQIYSVNADQRP
jgi:hypothetical protein